MGWGGSDGGVSRLAASLRVVRKKTGAGVRTYEQAAVGTAVNGQLGGGGVALLDEILGGALEVCEAVLLVGQHAGWGRKKKQRL